MHLSRRACLLKLEPDRNGGAAQEAKPLSELSGWWGYEEKGKVGQAVLWGRSPSSRVACAFACSRLSLCLGRAVVWRAPHRLHTLCILHRRQLRHSHLSNTSGHKSLRRTNNSTFRLVIFLIPFACHTIVSLLASSAKHAPPMARKPNKRVKLSPKPSAPLAAAFPRCNHSSQTALGTSIQLPPCIHRAGIDPHRQASTGIKRPFKHCCPSKKNDTCNSPLSWSSPDHGPRGRSAWS
jgi:hypothetical protein